MKKTLLFLCLGISSMLVFAGCHKEEPVAEEPVAEEVDEESIEVVEEPEPEEIDIDALMPEFPMMNEDGSIYHAEKVTSDVFEAKVNELWEKYATNDYEKCVIACNVAAVNNGDVFSSEAAYMYFSIYGYDIETQYAKTFYERDWGNEEVPFSAYFIDEKTAKEMDKFEEMMRVLNDENTPEETKEKIVEKIKEQAKAYNDLIISNDYSENTQNMPMGLWYEAILYKVDPSFIMTYFGDDLYLHGNNVHYGTPVDESSYVINQQVYDMNIGRYEEYCEEWDSQFE